MPQVSDSPDLRALEAFVVENEDLEKLEGIMSQFNIFEATGAVRRELRHSDLLAFLLNPQESHGLGDVFARRLLQRSLRESASTAAVSPIEIDVWDPEWIEVRREWNNIDILVVDERSKIAVIIENKIDTTEHSNQLARYHRRVSDTFPSFRVLPLFRTPAGVPPSDDRYIAID